MENLTVDELLELMKMKMKLDRLRKRYGVIADADLYYMLKDVSELLDDIIGEKRS